MQTHQSIRYSHIWQRKRILGQQESLVLIRLSTDKRLRWTCAALWIFTRALTRCSHKWHTHRRSSMHMGFWYCYEGSSEPVQMCRLTRTFASGTQISIWATTWYFGTVTNHWVSLFSRAFSACKNDTEIAIWESTRFWHLSHCEVTTALASLHICADSFVWAFATVLKCRVFDQMVIGLSLIRAANAWRVCTFAWDTQQCDCEGESAHVCTESPESSSLDNALSTKRSCWLKWWYGSHLC